MARAKARRTTEEAGGRPMKVGEVRRTAEVVARHTVVGEEHYTAVVGERCIPVGERRTRRIAGEVGARPMLVLVVVVVGGGEAHTRLDIGCTSLESRYGCRSTKEKGVLYRAVTGDYRVGV